MHFSSIKKVLLVVPVLLLVSACFAQQVLPLYQTVPNSITDTSVHEKTDTTNGRIRTSQVTIPTLTAFFPAKDKANGTAVIICPGGGYSYLVMNQEGTDVAQALVKKGVAAFVLKYRLPNAKIMSDKSIGPLQDAQMAIYLVRLHARDWNIDTGKVGIMGFSAGGHVAATASTHFNDKILDLPAGANLRPDFSVLVYPVISFSDSLAHKGSRKALLGDPATEMNKNFYSAEKQVNAATPPAFLIQSGDDKIVLVGNSLAYCEALIRNNVRCELHIYPAGGHGFGMNNKAIADPWLDRCFNWMLYNKLLTGL